MKIAMLSLAVAAGCTSSSGGGISGDLPGGSFQPVDSVSAAITISDGAGGSTSDARVWMATTPHLCSDAGATPPIARKMQRFILISVRDVAGAVSTAPTAPGTYTIYPDSGTEPPKAASLSAGAFDATCQPNDADDAKAQSGTITLASVAGGAFTGSFDVVLNSGGHLSGSFDPQPCPALQAAVTSMDAPACL